MSTSRLQKLLAVLRRRYGTPKPLVGGRDPFALIIAEMVAYLADDDTRRKAFEALTRQVGITPKALLDAPLPMLAAICRLGGPVAPEHRAKRMKLAAAMVIDDFDGDLAQVLAWDYKRAVRAFRKLPSIAEPGADRILMICGSHPVLGLESNALRVLCRVGYGEETKNYTKTYRSSRDAAAAELPKKPAVLTHASLLLREHGKETCKYTTPRCEECPLTAWCAYFLRLNARRDPKPTSGQSPRRRSRAPSSRRSPE
jgi:endonuclease III